MLASGSVSLFCETIASLPFPDLQIWPNLEESSCFLSASCSTANSQITEHRIQPPVLRLCEHLQRYNFIFFNSQNSCLWFKSAKTTIDYITTFSTYHCVCILVGTLGFLALWLKECSHVTLKHLGSCKYGWSSPVPPSIPWMTDSSSWAPGQCLWYRY